MLTCSITNDWPPNYSKVYEDRQWLYYNLKANKSLINGAKEHYLTRPIKFINDWCITYDPRNSSEINPTVMPFILFRRQDDLVDFIMQCFKDRESGMVEKTRDMGATWVCVCLSVWFWLFVSGSSIGWGSRKELLVDKLGDPDSIFEKIRMTIRYIPDFFLPKYFDKKMHASYMRIINPENGSTITGEAGNNIGRGGRKTIYFVDEAAHLEQPEMIEASLSHNTDVRIDISSVNGTTNVFARKRRGGRIWTRNAKIEKGVTRVFIFDWRDHPNKTQDWYNKKRDKAEREGLQHIFAQEVDRDYLSSVDMIVIPPQFVNAAIDAHKVLNIKPTGEKIGALDVADEGGDKNAYTYRHGIVCLKCIAWGQGDPGETTKKTIAYMKKDGCTNLQYDPIGVGSGVKTAINLLIKSDKYIKKISLVKWNAGARVLHPDKRIIPRDKDTPKNADFFLNLKAQAWWQCRVRFEKTYNAIVKGIKYDPDELISIDSNIDDLHELKDELSQPTYLPNNAGKIVINKKPSGTRSPNKADSFVMCYWPLRSKKVMI